MFSLFNIFAYLSTRFGVDFFFPACLTSTVKAQLLTSVMGICIDAVQCLQKIFSPHNQPCCIVLQH